MKENTPTETPSTEGNWRCRLIDNPALLTVMLRRITLWMLADSTNAEGDERYWWILQSTAFKFNFTVFVILALFIGSLMYFGILQMIGTGLISIFSRQVGQKSVCGKPIKNKHAVHSLGTFVDAQAWNDYLIPPYPNITDHELARGIINIEYPNQLSRVSLDLGDVQTQMKAMSKGQMCVCAADLYIPLNVFAFNEKMYWRITQWTSPPTGNSSCFDTPLMAPDYAKGMVSKLCGDKGEYTHFTKGVLCCMEFCTHSQGIFSNE